MCSKCLKNVVTDDVICSNAGLTRYVEDEDNEDDNSEKATFTATRLMQELAVIAAPQAG